MYTGKFCRALGLGALAWLITPGSVWAVETLEYNIRWDTDYELYRVFMRPGETPVPNASMTAQVTIRVPHGTGSDRFMVSELTSTINETNWAPDSRTNAPAEDPSVDYISFTLNMTNSSAFKWQANQEIEVFNFINTGSCIGIVEMVNNDTDPMVTVVSAGGTNSAGTNPGNQFSNLGWADYSAENNYLGNYGGPALCTDSYDYDNDGIINGDEKAIGSDPNNSDSDGDGVPDSLEIGAGPDNPRDSDNDGIPDIIDVDDDNDGLLTVTENYNGGTALDDDTDGDGIPDYLDPDDDGDGLLTISESGDPDNNSDPSDATDTDGDGLPDYRDITDNRPDTDKDGIKDVEDQDDDGDGIPDILEGDGLTHSDTDAMADSLDTDSDNDGVPDSLEGHDANSDGIADISPISADINTNGLDDAFDVAEGGSAAPLQDTDKDGTPDFQDNDDDGDSKLTGTEDSNNDNDNNPATDPLDVDADGIPDYLDNDEKDGPAGDADDDGLTNAEEVALGTDPEDSDSDNDGRSDTDELRGPDGDIATTTDNTNPLDADSDDDGLSDGAELAGIDNNVSTSADNTDPNKADSDGDGLQDGTELGVVLPIAGGNSDGSAAVVFVGTDFAAFVADTHPASTTDPNNPDTDNGGDCDGSQAVAAVCVAGEDQNDNGGIDAGESNPLLASDDLGEGVQLQVRAMLQGPYDVAQGLMNDDLRVKGFLPVEQPYNSAPTNYAGDETLALGLAQIEGDDAIVDWVLLELRDNGFSTVAAKAMLIQRDGDIVDGQSGDSVWRPQGVVAGSYYVVIRHRNHLDLITVAPVALSRLPGLVDFSLSTTAVAGNNMRLEIDDTALMYTGDINFDQRSIANGPAQDSTSLISSILLYPDNQSFNANYVMSGYHAGDLNLDGNTIFSGPGNEMNILLGNVLSHTENKTLSANYIVNGSLDE